MFFPVANPSFSAYFSEDIRTLLALVICLTNKIH